MLSGDRFTEKMQSLAEEKNYGRGPGHILSALRYSKEIYAGLAQAQLIEDNNRDLQLLIAACYLHDVGVNVSDGELGVKILPEDDHNLKSFKWFHIRLDQADCNGLFTDSEKAIVKYCILWHKGNAWELRPELEINWHSLLRARLLAAILRVGDALSSSFGKHVPAISPEAITIVVSGHTLFIKILPQKPGEIKDADLVKARERGKDLMAAVMKAMAFAKINDVQINLTES